MPQAQIQIVDVTASNLLQMPCCGIKNVEHEGHVAKTAWLKRQLKNGLRGRVLLGEDGRQCGYIEYTPGEHAWRAVDAAGYMFINCIWTFYKKYQRKGHAKRLVRDCIEEAEKAGMKGVAVVARQKPWLVGSDLFLRCGFTAVETAPPDYELLALKFREDTAAPRFRRMAEDNLKKYSQGLTIISSDQCPHAVKFAREIAECALAEYGLNPRMVRIRSSRAVRSAPNPFVVFSIMYNGQLLADHPISRTRFRNIMKTVLGPGKRSSTGSAVSRVRGVRGSRN
jgi:N-acetylglutamate synthase-like GNAT family acetyltransferase